MKRLPSSNDAPNGFRKFPDGTLVAPKRGGVAPKAPPGYEAAPWDPWTFIPALAACPYRARKKLPDNCCGRTPPLFCKFADKNIVRADCMKCEAKPEEYFRK